MSSEMWLSCEQVVDTTATVGLTWRQPWQTDGTRRARVKLEEGQLWYTANGSIVEVRNDRSGACKILYGGHGDEDSTAAGREAGDTYYVNTKNGKYSGGMHQELNLTERILLGPWEPKEGDLGLPYDLEGLKGIAAGNAYLKPVRKGGGSWWGELEGGWHWSIRSRLVIPIRPPQSQQQPSSQPQRSILDLVRELT